MTDNIHLAGVIDARRGSLGETPDGYLLVALRMPSADKHYILDLHEKYGGTLFANKGGWNWKVAGAGAVQLVEDIQPYLRLKTKLATRLLQKHAETRAKEGVNS